MRIRVAGVTSTSPPGDRGAGSTASADPDHDDDAVSTDTAHRPIAATALLFAANGAIFGAIVPRLPDLKDALELSPALFGLAMACYPAGALFGGLLTPVLMRRRSDGAVAVGTMIAASVVAALVGFSPVVAVFAGLLLLFGVCDAITDVSMNAHGIRVQLRHGRSLINRFHAVWSLGAVLGAAGGSLSAGFGAPVQVQMIGAAIVCAAAAAAAYPLRLGPPVAEDEYGRDLDRVHDTDTASTRHEAASHGAAPSPAQSVDPVVRRRLPGGRALLLLVALGLFACCAEIVEDFAQTWSALYLRDVAAVGAGVAGLGFIAVQGAQLIGRLTGDRLVEGFGAVRVGRMGGICVVLGAGAALNGSFFLDGPAMVAVLLAGFAVAGWGIATIIPGAMVGADSVPGLPDGAGLAVLNWVMRLGFLLAPPLVGQIAEHVGMRWAVAPMVVGGLLIAVLAGPLLGRSAGPDRATTRPDREAAA
ncbi:MFS transporter [Dietzia aurantiaca]|nr:MFS transporter [Dietzia aurantiaca]